MEPRRRETPNPRSPHQRSERFSQEAEGWYFRTREQILVGPFPTRFDAELSASLLCARLSQLEHDGESPQVIRSFMLDQVSSHRTIPDPAAIDWDAIRRTARRERRQDLASRVVDQLRNLAAPLQRKS